MQELFDFLTIAEKMKCVKRDNLLSNGEYEDDAAHSWMVGLMAMYFAPKLKTKVDLEHCLKLAIIHDLPEAKVGDVPLYEAINDKSIRDQKEQNEQKAIAELREILPDAGDEIYELWQEYEANKTPEAKFVKALDKLEATFQALCYKDIKYWGRYGDGRIYYDIVLNDRKKSHYEHEEVLVEFAEYLKSITIEKMRSAGLDPNEYKEEI